MVDDGIGSGPEIDHLMMFLGTYVRSHFAYEESRMAPHRCPTAGPNEEVLGDFLSFHDGIDREHRTNGGSVEMIQRLKFEMGRWLVDHICRIFNWVENLYSKKSHLVEGSMIWYYSSDGLSYIAHLLNRGMSWLAHEWRDAMLLASCDRKCLVAVKQ